MNVAGPEMSGDRMSPAPEGSPTLEARVNPEAWVLAPMVPIALDLDATAVLAWGAAVLVGALVAGNRPLRWVAVAWSAWTVARPDALLGGAAVSGLLAAGWRERVFAVVLGTVLGLLVPGVLRTAGVAMIAAAAVLVLARFAGRGSRSTEGDES